MEQKSLTSVISALNKKYGEGTIQLYGKMKAVNIDRFSSGLPSLDLIIGGGIPEGRIMSILGMEASGKTSLAITILAQAQKKYPNKKLAFLDIEHALSPDYARTLGLDIDNIFLSQPDSAEGALEIMDALVSSGEFKVVVLDSVAQLTPNVELTKEIGDAEFGARARLMGQALRKISPKASKNKCTCIFINQLRASMAMYGNPITSPGGKALPYASSIVLHASSKKIDEKTGETTIDVKKNKVGKPFGKTKVIIRYGLGFDLVQDIITTGLMTGVIKKSGPMISFADRKWKGEVAMREEVSGDQKLQKEIEEVIRNSTAE